MDALKPAELHILLALADDDSYGYAIMQSVREQSEGRVPLQTGSLYRYLGRLIEGGLVDEAPQPDDVDDPRRGTYYRLTSRGRQRLEAERRYLSDVVAALEGLPAASEDAR